MYIYFIFFTELNEELVECVVARDELHMQQDSILVNIEDLQRSVLVIRYRKYCYKIVAYQI